MGGIAGACVRVGGEVDDYEDASGDRCGGVVHEVLDCGYRQFDIARNTYLNSRSIGANLAKKYGFKDVVLGIGFWGGGALTQNICRLTEPS